MGNGKCQEGTISSSLKIQKRREENVSHFQEMIANADKDGTGTLDIIEFLQMMKEKISEQNKEEEIGEAFRVFDIVSIGVDLDQISTFSLFRIVTDTSTGESWA